MESLGLEYQGATLGDYRLSNRLERLGESAGRAPENSFPKLFATSAELEAAYRFFNNRRVRWSEIHRVHQQRSFERAMTFGEIVVAHDTTEFSFSNQSSREGLGRLYGSERWLQGFFGHFSLAISTDGQRLPLGVVGAKFLSRSAQARKIKRDRSIPNGRHNESYRWFEQVLSVEQDSPKGLQMVHVMDREADSYELFDGLVQNGCRFVIRLCRDRRLEDSGERLFDRLSKARTVVKRTVKLSRRKDSRSSSERKIHPPRDSREATFGISAKAFTLKRSGGLHGKCSDSLLLNFVHVRELKPPKGTEPVDWKLVTTEPIDCAEQLEKIVDYYRARWVIEEYFKVIKTGCKIEQRQQESLRGLLNVLAVFLPVAWWLLMARNLARGPELSAKGLITDIQKALLEAKYPDMAEDLLTIRGVLYAVARLGGHIKYNGPPGWQTIYSGYRDLLMMEAGYLLLTSRRSAAISD